MSTSLYSTAIHEAAHAVIAVRTARGNKHGLAKNGIVTIEPAKNYLGRVQTKNSGSRKHRWERQIVDSLAGGVAQCRVEPPVFPEFQVGVSGDSRNILSTLGNLHPSKLFERASHLAFRSDVFEEEKRLYGWTDDIVHERFLKETSAEQIAEANLLVQRINAAVAILCSTGNGQQGAGVFATKFTAHISVISEPWFKTLGQLTDRTAVLLDTHWADVHRLANRLLEVGTMTGPEAEAFITGVSRSEEEEQLRREVSRTRRNIASLWNVMPFDFSNRKDHRRHMKDWRARVIRKFPSKNAQLQKLEERAAAEGWTLPKWRDQEGYQEWFQEMRAAA